MRAESFLLTVGLVAMGASACRPTEAQPEPPPIPASSLPTVPDAAPISAPTPAPGPTASQASPRPSSSAVPVSGQPLALATWWTSQACPARPYKRTLNLLPNHTFEAADVVHPCPQECVVQWVDTRKGTWSSSGAALSLVVKSEEGPPAEKKDAVALPTTLTIDAASRTLVEANPACVYAAP